MSRDRGERLSPAIVVTGTLIGESRYAGKQVTPFSKAALWGANNWAIVKARRGTVKAVLWAVCFLFAETLAFGQRGGEFGSAAGGPRGMASGLPPVGPIPPLGPVGPRFPVGRGFDRSFSPFGYPVVLGDYAYPPSYEPAPAFVFAPPPPPPVIVVPPPPPPPPARSEIREYKMSPEAQPAAAGDEPKFAIALKDGSVRYAVVTFVQGNTLAYVDPDGRQQRVSGEDVDRDATKRLNQALKLNLYLPPPAH
jgi:hypothetical protein